MEGKDGAEERKGRVIALCVSQWNHPTVFYAWTWMKQWFLRKGPDAGLDPSETLLIVRVGKHLDETPKWKVGGPLIPDLDTALEKYPHQIVKLQGSIQSQMKSFTEQHNIDVVVLGDEFPQSGFKLTSVTDWVKQNVTCPFIIIRPEAVRNSKMRIDSGKGSLSRLGSPEREEGGADGLRVPRPASPGCSRGGRKVCIAYERFDVGYHLIEVAKQLALEPEDTVYMAHCYEKSGPAEKWLHPSGMMKQAGKLARAMTFQKGGQESNAPVTLNNSIDFGAKELEDYNVVLNVVLKGEPKQALDRFCEKEGIDLLVIGTRTVGKLRKTFTGGSVSGHLIDHAHCPCLVIPYKPAGISTETSQEDVGAEGLSPRVQTSPLSWSLADYFASPGVDAATQTESTVEPPQATSVAAQLEVGASSSAAAAAEAGAGVVAPSAAAGAAQQHSTPSDMLAVLRQQLEEKDRTIAELRAQVQQLQLAQAQSRETQTHDPMHTPASY